MEIHQLEQGAKLKRDKSIQAIAFASQGRWKEAVATNKELLKAFPDDVESLNRLGKAHSETGHYAAARKALERALKLSPSNNIAKKNLDRMAGLKDAPISSKFVGTTGRLAPQVFIDESGKSTTTTLLGVGVAAVLGQITSGDTVEFVVDGATVEVQNHVGQRLGRLEPKLAGRLIKLLDGGNKYLAAVASISGKNVTLVVRETYQSSKLKGYVSFPAPKGRAPAYIADMDLDIDEGTKFDTSGSRASSAADADLADDSSEESSPVKAKQQRSTRALSDEDVEDEDDEEIEV
jgi:tetratricopeptide (TPR) repeat protein